MINTDYRNIDLVTSGTGHNILFVPGSFSTPAAWKSVQEKLPQKYRFLTTSLCGYGKTAETRALDDYFIDHEIDVLNNIIDQIQEPVHLVGHSFGGVVCFAAALIGKAEIKSVTTYEANPVGLLKSSSKQGYRTLNAIRKKFETEYFSGELGAARIVIDYWGGEGSFASMPTEVQDYCKSTTFANVLDWRTGFSFLKSKKDYQNLSLPCLIIRGERANFEMIEITNALSNSIPNSKTAIVSEANHFLITSHPTACANLLADFLQELD